ncbi:nuclear transport factor 2 family protein [Microbacterium ureisolvens]|uniref:Nuclear transport factor 2 family protein n=1 Tax=Microbacterium ureisolvens TaxID=2781186 RepID=A0ABS7HT08_9MICO|nr:nuclear transport factor 2 family protein [Microbacterium ureisolvens]MBW9108250.1 nuclear transport factor 2 family protein [Microbacterium ureisolvens]
MSTVAELLRLNLHGVFGNRDAAVRRDAAARAYSPGVTLTDPEGTVVGPEAVLASAAALLKDAPEESVLVEDGPAYASDTTGVLPWAFGPPGAPVVRGIDLITVENGMITSTTVLLAEG